MAQIIQPWRFTSPEAKLTVHIRDRAPNGELLGLLMHDARDPKQIVTYLSERARIIKQDGQAYLRMDKGHIVRRLENETSPQIIVFDRYAVDANQLEQRTDQTNIMRPRQRIRPSSSPRSQRPHLQDESGKLRRRAARALRQPSLCLRLRASGGCVHGPGPDHPHEPHASRHCRLCRRRAQPHPRHHLRQYGGGASGGSRRCSMRCLRSQRCWPPWRSSGTCTRGGPPAVARAVGAFWRGRARALALCGRGVESPRRPGSGPSAPCLDPAPCAATSPSASCCRSSAPSPSARR